MCWVCTQPLMLPVHQNPLAAFLLRQAPMAILRLRRLFRRIGPDGRIEPHGPEFT